MNIQESYKKGLYNKFEFPKDIQKNIDKQKCCICGKKVDYWIFPQLDRFDIHFYNISFKGLQNISCKRCFDIKFFLDNFTFRIMFFIFRLKIKL